MKAFFTLLGTGRLLTLLACALLGLLACFLKFCVPGYSFSALVCVCLIAILLFYTFMPMIGLKFPAMARWTTRIFSLVLAIGLLMAGGLKPLQTISIAAAFPFVIIMVVTSASMIKSLSDELKAKEKV